METPFGLVNSLERHFSDLRFSFDLAQAFLDDLLIDLNDGFKPDPARLQTAGFGFDELNQKISALADAFSDVQNKTRDAHWTATK